MLSHAISIGQSAHQPALPLTFWCAPPQRRRRWPGSTQSHIATSQSGQPDEHKTPPHFLVCSTTAEASLARKHSKPPSTARSLAALPSPLSPAVQKGGRAGTREAIMQRQRLGRLALPIVTCALMASLVVLP